MTVSFDRRSGCSTHTLTPFALLLLLALAPLRAAHAAAEKDEAPPVFKASALLAPELLKGPHHHVAEPVKTEAYFHEFTVESDYGALQAVGMSQLRVRVQEVDALSKLDDVSKSEVFLKAAGNSVVNVGKGVASAVKDPVATAKGIGGGIKRMGVNLGRKAKRGADSAKDAATEDEKEKQAKAKASPAPEKSTAEKAGEAGASGAKSIVGISAAARRWAAKVGADPYTSNPVLRKALEDIGKVDAAGGLVTKVVVPIPMVVTTTASVGNLVWGKDPEELLKINEQRLAELGVDKKVSSELLRSKLYSPSADTRFVAALHAVKAKGSADYVDTASTATGEREALFFVESAEMLERFAAETPVAAVLTDSRALVARTAELSSTLGS